VYVDFLEQHFKPPGVRPTPLHKALFDLDPPLILTTNYDRLLENAYAEVYRNNATVYTYSAAHKVQKFLQSGRFGPSVEGPIIFKIHGTIEEPDDIILSMRDYRQILYWERESPFHALRCILWGSSTPRTARRRHVTEEVRVQVRKPAVP
jgi:hypothetical protein